MHAIEPGNDEPEVSSWQRRCGRYRLGRRHVPGETTNEVPGESFLHFMLKGVKSGSPAIHPNGGIVKLRRFHENL